MSDYQITLVLAASTNGVIGREGDLPWELSNDFKHFKELTLGKVIVMGRKTWESLPIKPLPNRESWVMSRTPLELPKGVHQPSTIDSVLKASITQEIMIIGGATIYEAFFPHATKIELTQVLGEIEGDTYFQVFPLTEDWTQVSNTFHPADEKNQYDHRFITLFKKPVSNS